MIDKLIEVMGILSSLFKNYYQEQIALRDCLLNKDNDNLNPCIEKMQNTIMSINMLEKKRDLIFNKIKEAVSMREEDGFDFLIAKPKKEKAEKLSQAREELKYHVFASQRMDITMANILDTKISLINAMMSEIYPEKKTANYSSQGSYQASKPRRQSEAKILNYEF